MLASTPGGTVPQSSSVHDPNPWHRTCEMSGFYSERFVVQRWNKHQITGQYNGHTMGQADGRTDVVVVEIKKVTGTSTTHTVIHDIEQFCLSIHGGEHSLLWNKSGDITT